MTKTHYRERRTYHPYRLKAIMLAGIGVMIAGIALLDINLGFGIMAVAGPCITLEAEVQYEKIPQRRQPRGGKKKIYNIDIITLKKEDCNRVS